MRLPNLADLRTRDADTGSLFAVIETPKGSRNKYAFDPEAGVFDLSKVLPRGMVFPFDFGFVPSTAGGDGDPLDVLVIMDEPAFPGCRVRCRLIGVIEAEQTTKRGVVRNDRLIAVAEECREDTCVRSLKDLPDGLVEEIQHFFASYHEFDGKRFRPLARHGPRRAGREVREGVKRFRAAGGDRAEPPANGKSAGAGTG